MALVLLLWAVLMIMALGVAFCSGRMEEARLARSGKFVPFDAALELARVGKLSVVRNTPESWGRVWLVSGTVDEETVFEILCSPQSQAVATFVPPWKWCSSLERCFPDSVVMRVRITRKVCA